MAVCAFAGAKGTVFFEFSVQDSPAVYTGVVYKGGGSRWVPQRAAYSSWIFPQQKIWAKIVFGWVGLRAKRPPLPLVNKAWVCSTCRAS